MSSPLIEGNAFTIDPEAQRLHEAGLRWELEGRYPLAHATFEAALGVLAEIPASVDVAVQSSRIKRDNGFTYARSSIQSHDITELDKADKQVRQADAKTAVPIIQVDKNSLGPVPPLRLSRNKTRELYSEHGATVSLAGRLATVREVVFNETDEADPVSKTYVAAHRFLVKGSNGYYRVSNAMVTARQERIDNNLSAMSRWLGKGAIGLAWTVAFDRVNLKPSVLTFGSRLRHLRSHKAAVDSVTAKP